MSALKSHDLARRSSETELMDTEPVDIDEYRRCLQDLAAVNTVTLTRRPILRWLERAMPQVGPGERRLAARCRLRLRRRAAGHPRLEPPQRLRPRPRRTRPQPHERTDCPRCDAPDMAIDFRTGDVFTAELGRRFDFVISSQMTHHLSDEALVAFIQWMERTAVRGWFIGDLHRHAIPLHAFGLLARLAGWHRFVQHDGPVSIARSFRRAGLAAAARGRRPGPDGS